LSITELGITEAQVNIVDGDSTPANLFKSIKAELPQMTSWGENIVKKHRAS